MKKLIAFLFISVVFLVTSFAQDATLTESNTYKTAGGATADTIVTTTSVTKAFLVNVQDECTYLPFVLLTKVSGTPDTVFVVTYGSHDGTNYVTVDTDTILTAGATKVAALSAKTDISYRYYKFIATGDNNTATQRVTYFMKIWKK